MKNLLCITWNLNNQQAQIGKFANNIPLGPHLAKKSQK